MVHPDWLSDYQVNFLPRIIGVLYALAGVAYLTLLWQPLAKYLYPYNLALAGPEETARDPKKSH